MVNREKLKILHLASFNGNIGDMLSHQGLYLKLTEILHKIPYEIERLDLRRFYQNAQKRLSFDSNCAKKFNRYDIVIIGGGGFLKQSFPNTLFGNTFNFDVEFLRIIDTKILFYSIGGLSALDEVDISAYKKTEKLLEIIVNHKSMYLLLRSDGTMRNSAFLSSMDPDNDKVMEIFDSAYLNNRVNELTPKNNVIINLGEDQLRQHQKGYSTIIKLTAERINLLYEYNPDLIFKFIPHTYYDVRAFSNLCELLPEHLIRNNMKCCETYSLSSDLQKTVEVYKSASLALTGRFHSTAFALLYSRRFQPLYRFSRSVEQLSKIGIDLSARSRRAEVDDPLDGLGIDFDEIKVERRLESNRIITGSFLSRLIIQ
jgi:polysaccharide pyruvyl transferase WcaK-like protein